MSTIFISHAPQDAALAESLADALVDAGHQPHYRAPHKPRLTDDEEETERWKRADLVVVLASPASIGRRDVAGPMCGGVCRSKVVLVLCGLGYGRIVEAGMFWENAYFGEAPVQLLPDRDVTIARVVARVNSTARLVADERARFGRHQRWAEALKLGWFTAALEVCIGMHEGRYDAAVRQELSECLRHVRRSAASQGLPLPKRISDLTASFNRELCNDAIADGTVTAALCAVGFSLSVCYHAIVRNVSAFAEASRPIPAKAEEHLSDMFRTMEEDIITQQGFPPIDLQRLRTKWERVIADARSGRGDPTRLDQEMDFSLSTLFGALDELQQRWQHDNDWKRRASKASRKRAQKAARSEPGLVDVFINCVDEDTDTARSIVAMLEQGGFSSVFLGMHDFEVPHGASLTAQIIHDCRAEITLVSPRSIDCSLLWGRAIQSHLTNRVTIPVLCDLSYAQLSSRESVSGILRRAIPIDLVADIEVATRRILYRVGVATRRRVPPLPDAYHRRQLAKSFLLGFRVAGVRRILDDLAGSRSHDRSREELTKQSKELRALARALSIEPGKLDQGLGDRLCQQLAHRGGALERVLDIGRQVGDCHHSVVHEILGLSQLGQPIPEQLFEIPPQTIDRCVRQLACDPIAPAIDLAAFDFAWDEAIAEVRAGEGEVDTLRYWTEQALRQACGSIERT